MDMFPPKYKYINRNIQICFHQKCFWLKRHLHCTISRRPRTAFSKQLEIKYLYIPVCLRQKYMFQRRRKLLSGEELNNFLQAARSLELVKCFEIIILIGTFGNSTIFQHFDTSANSTETPKFPRQFGLQGQDGR